MSAARFSRMARRLIPWWRRFKRSGYRVDRCAHCGHRFRWKRDARHANGNRDGKVFHGPCLAYLTWRRKAESRLDILALTLDVAGVTSGDIKGAAELRAISDDERRAVSSRAFSVFFDLERSSVSSEATS
jgi:hypothetical protein